MADLDFTALFIQVLILVISLSVHEAAHAWSADKLGDPTARLLGRVSLNPAVHIDPIGTLVFPLIAMTTGAPVLGWAKPVPVNPVHLRQHWKQKFMLIAAAGPASNLALAAVGIVLFRLLPLEMSGPAAAYVVTGLVRAVFLNIGLAVFNLIPVPPLDGGNILAGLLRGRAADLFDQLRPYGFFIIYGLLLSGVVAQVMQPVGVIANALLR